MEHFLGGHFSLILFLFLSLGLLFRQLHFIPSSVALEVFDLVEVFQRLRVQLLQVLVRELRDFELVADARVDGQLVHVTYCLSGVLVIYVDDLLDGRLVGQRFRVENGHLLIVRDDVHGASDVGIPGLHVRQIHVGGPSIGRRKLHGIPRHEIVSHGGMISSLKRRFVPSHVLIQRFLFAAKRPIETLMARHILLRLEKPGIVPASHQLLPLVEASSFGSLCLKLHEIGTGRSESTMLTFLRMGRFHI